MVNNLWRHIRQFWSDLMESDTCKRLLFSGLSVFTLSFFAWLIFSFRGNSLTYEEINLAVLFGMHLLPGLVLFLFSIFAGHRRSVNDRIYPAILLIVLIALQLMASKLYPDLVYPHIMELCDVFEFLDYDFLCIALFWIKVLILALIPIMSGYFLYGFSGAMSVLYFLCFFFLLLSDELSYSEYWYLWISDGFLYASLLNYGNLFTDDNKSSLCRRIFDVVTAPIVRWLYSGTDDDDDDFFETDAFNFDEFEDTDTDTDTDTVRTERFSSVGGLYAYELSYHRLLTAAMIRGREDLLLASELLRKLSIKQFVDSDGKLFSPDAVWESYSVIYGFMNALREEGALTVDDKMAAHLAYLVSNRDSRCFMADAAMVAALLYGTCSPAWYHAVLDDQYAGSFGACCHNRDADSAPDADETPGA